MRDFRPGLRRLGPTRGQMMASKRTSIPKWKNSHLPEFAIARMDAFRKRHGIMNRDERAKHISLWEQVRLARRLSTKKVTLPKVKFLED